VSPLGSIAPEGRGCSVAPMAIKSPDDLDRERVTRLAIAAVIVIVVLVFALVNRERVTVDWIIFERRSRLIYVIIGSALLGALADRLLQRRHRAPKE
jgi:uncharacterized integral membrane protein